MQENNDIFIFATYWNESYWLDKSLKQIRDISPKKTIISQGCYDVKKSVDSTDDTIKKLEVFKETFSDTEIISPFRAKNKFQILLLLIKLNLLKYNKISTLKVIKAFLSVDIYRANQALTFNYMLKKSNIKEGEWFSTYDSDQFYNEKFFEILQKIKYIDNKVKVIKAKEYTFFENQNEYTDEKEKRMTNNMPHRYCDNTIILPTRNIYLQKFAKLEKYEVQKSINAGYYFHYKFSNGNRLVEGYELGDRKAPSYDGLKIKRFKGVHPVDF